MMKLTEIEKELFRKIDGEIAVGTVINSAKLRLVDIHYVIDEDGELKSIRIRDEIPTLRDISTSASDFFKVVLEENWKLTLKTAALLHSYLEGGSAEDWEAEHKAQYEPKSHIYLRDPEIEAEILRRSLRNQEARSNSNAVESAQEESYEVIDFGWFNATDADHIAAARDFINNGDWPKGFTDPEGNRPSKSEKAFNEVTLILAKEYATEVLG